MNWFIKLINYPLDILMLPIQLLIAFFTIYYFVFSIIGLRSYRKEKFIKPQKRFVILVPAHNEATVITHLVENLLSLKYPKNLYDVIVIADNCSDNTAQLVREKGAIAYERENKALRGKGYALQWMINLLLSQKKDYDAVVIFDADNLVHPDFLQHMNEKLCQGSKIIQGYIDSKNPFDTWVTATFSIAFWQVNRMMQLARNNLGLSCYLGGTGMCIDMEMLRKFGWNATSLAEDLEFSVKALTEGIKTDWAHDAVVYDEKPLTFAQAWKQRKRWAQGHIDLLYNYFLTVFWGGIRKGSLQLFDCSLVLFQPILVLAAGFFAVVAFVQAYHLVYTPYLYKIIPNILWQLISIFQTIYPLIVLVLDRLPKSVIRWIIMYPIFIYSWVLIVFISFISPKTNTWSHTVHTRGVSYNEIVKNR